MPAPSPVVRCPWRLNGNELYIEYHDNEWGVPAWDDRTQFEFLILEGAQAGLSWSTILNKREGYREAFAGFDPERIARFGKRDVTRLMKNPGIVRNRLKIESAISNAQAPTWNSSRSRQLRAAPVELRRRQADPAPLRAAQAGAGRPARIRRAQQGSEEARLPLRRQHHHLRAHAGDRHGERSSHQLFSLQASARRWERSLR